MAKARAKCESFFDRVVVAVSSAFGLGAVPFAPGTWGTLGAFPIWWTLNDQPVEVWAVAVFSIFWLAVGICGQAERLYGEHDVSAIVIDEVVGMLVCVFAFPLTWKTGVLGFVVFRFFDIVKPPPVRWFDRHVNGGLGVVLDDVVAGALGFGVMCGWIFGLGW